jgi:hypothetical protein
MAGSETTWEAERQSARRVVGGESQLAREDALFLRLGEGFLQARLRRWWLGSVFGRRHRAALDSVGVLGGEASALLRLPSLRLRVEDAGRIRLDCEADIELSLGLPGLGRQLAASFSVLVEPRIEGLDEETSRPSIALDFAAAQVRELSVRPTGEGRGWMLDPMTLDPFADWRRAELGKLVVRGLLDRVGARRFALDTRVLSRIAEATHLDPDGLALRVGEGEIDVGFLAPRADESQRGVVRSAGEGGKRRHPHARRPALVVWASESVVERLLGLWLLHADGAREWDELALRLGEGVVELRSLVRVVRPAWARRLGLRTTARLHVGASDERLWAVLDSLAIESPGWLTPGSAWAARRLAAELEHRGFAREIAHPRIVDGLGGLRIAGVGLADKSVEIELQPYDGTESFGAT